MQLFTHLLSSYLQGMGDFFSALPRGENANLVWSFPKVAALTFCSALIILNF